MTILKSLPRLVRFGVYELDSHAGELRKNGIRLKLEEKPRQILGLLLEQPGEIVTRKRLKEELWTNTFVDFDYSLNTAVSKLRQALGDSADSPRYVETAPRRGYRFIAPVDGRESRQSSAKVMLAVLPFENLSREPEQEYFSDGLTEEMITRLGQLRPRQLGVIARTSSMRYKGAGKEIGQISRELGVGYVLEGSVRSDGNRLRITAQLIQARDQTHLWAETYDRSWEDVFAIQEEVARSIASSLSVELLPATEEPLAQAPSTHHTKSSDAYLDYLKGRFHYNKLTEEGVKKSLVYFQQAIEKDPEFALAYVGLADAQQLFGFVGPVSSSEVISRIKPAVMKALELDDGLAEAHTSLANLEKVFEWDWAKAEMEYKRALQLNPNYANAHRFYAGYLSVIGRHQEAIQEIFKAIELDPLSLVVSNEVAWNLYMARDYNRSSEQSLKTLEMQPDFAPAEYTLGLAYGQMSRHEEAITAFQKARNASGNNPAILSALGHVYAIAGQRREAEEALNELQKTSRRSNAPPYWTAVIYAGLHKKEEAFEWLDKACRLRDVWIIWLRSEPRFDSLRSTAQFKDLLNRIGLAP